MGRAHSASGPACPSRGTGARGLGTAWTTIHLRYEKEVADILAIDMKKVTQCGLTPIAYTLGTDFQPAKRRPLDHSLHLDHW